MYNLRDMNKAKSTLFVLLILLVGTLTILSCNTSVTEIAQNDSPPATSTIIATYTPIVLPPTATFTPTLSATPTKITFPTVTPTPTLSPTPNEALIQPANQLSSSNNEDSVNKCLENTQTILSQAEETFRLGPWWMEPNPIAETFLQDFICWFNADGTSVELEELVDKFAEQSGKSDFITLDKIDLDGDKKQEIVAFVPQSNLPIFIFRGNENISSEKYTGYVLPHRTYESFEMLKYDREEPLQFTDLTGDGKPEIILQYVDIAPSTWINLYVYQWYEEEFRLIYSANVIDWAGYSTWMLAPDPTNEHQQQIILRYPWLYDNGYDHKLTNHPEAQQIWRWDSDLDKFVLAEESINYEKVSDRNKDMPSSDDRLRWLTNEGETAFRAGHYEKALQNYNQVLEFADSQNWQPEESKYDTFPDWRAYTMFRRAETLLLMGKPDDTPPAGYSSNGLEAMQDVANIWQDDLLGRLAETFLQAYSNGASFDAMAQALTAMYQVELDDLQKGQSKTLQFPIDRTGLFHTETLLATYLNTYLESIENLTDLEQHLSNTDLSIKEVVLTENNQICIVSSAVGGDRIPIFWLFAETDSNWKPVIPSIVMEWPQVGVGTPYYQRTLCVVPN